MNEPITSNDAHQSDGLTIRFIEDCPQGLKGEVVKKSSSTARSLVDRKLAEFVY